MKILQEELLANELERILRIFLDCNYLEFGVKANDNLLKNDWKSPINFSLDVLYGKKPELKDEINNFICNLLTAKSITDFVSQYENRQEALSDLEELIRKLEKLLNKKEN